MDKAIISLSFDDGREDNYRLFKKFTIPHNIPVTLNVATAYVDGSMPAESWPTKKGPMTKEQIIELSGCSSIELALHGDAHDNTEPDVRAGRDKLASWIGSPEDGKWGFASPYSKMIFYICGPVSKKNRLHSCRRSAERHANYCRFQSSIILRTDTLSCRNARIE